MNGSPKCYFKSSRRLCLGDPLSPMLFVIVVEALHVLMERAKSTSLITSFSIENAAYEVSHLQFANYIIIYCDASLAQVDMLKLLLKWLEWLLGLKSNYGKCEIIGVQTVVGLVDCKPSTFGSKVGKSSSKFLGFPLFLGLPKKYLWDPVVDWIDKKVKLVEGNVFVYRRLCYFDKICSFKYPHLLFVVS